MPSKVTNNTEKEKNQWVIFIFLNKYKEMVALCYTPIAGLNAHMIRQALFLSVVLF